MTDRFTRGTYEPETIPEVTVEIDIDREPFEQHQVFMKLVYGEPTQEQLFFYLQHGDIERLQQALEDNDMEIVYQRDDGEKVRIGPDDPMLNRRL